MFLSNFIENIFKSLNPEQVTGLFLLIISAVVVFTFFLSLIRKASAFNNYSDTLVTSLGILGTFVGIVIGLLDFDTSNIDNSIPNLLAGLKTAFLTSIYGLIAAVLINILNTLFFTPLSKVGKKIKVEDVGPKDIYQELITQNELSEKLHRSLAGDEEGSLVGQIKMLRSDLGDVSRIRRSLDTNEEGSFAHILMTHHSITREFFLEFQNNLFVKLDDFAEMLSKSATEQIIEALKNVIQDFNEKITEQFGENFKALDESVKKLVVWQDQYKLQVEQMSEQYQQSVNSLIDTRSAVAGIWEECKNIPQTMNDLKNVLGNL